jgi:hypothetical protein
MKSTLTSTKLLTVVVVLQSLILLGQWLGTPSVLPAAQAQVPDAGGQRMQIIKELEALNAKTERMMTLLESGKVTVRVSNMEEKPANRR